MKISKVLTLGSVVITLLFCLSSCSSNILLIKGDLNCLKGQETIKIEYDYSEMSVGKFDNGKDYINKRVLELNKKEAGRGDKWKELWTGSRITLYQPAFEEKINQYLSKISLKIDPSDDNAKYILVLKTTFTEPGFAAVALNKSPSVDIEAYLLDAKNRENILAIIFINKQKPIRNRDTPKGWKVVGDKGMIARLRDVYKACGKILGKFIVSNIK